MRYVFWLILLNSALLCQAATINAASCSQTDVQAAVNSAANGDTVVVPACPAGVAYTTTSGNNPSVNINKAITVQGQTVCTGRASTLSCTDNTLISDRTGTGAGEDPFLINSSNARLTGITIVGGTAGDYKFMIDTASNTTNWRIDHVHLHPSNTTLGGIAAQGFGLVDHCYIDTANTGISGQGDNRSDTTYNGDFNWKQALNPGSADAVYEEDNKFVYSQVLNGIDNYDGAKWVFRYNDVQGTNVANHGLDSTTNGRSTLLSEVYNNTFTNSGPHIYQWFVSRGGTHFIFNNTISAAGGSYDLFLDLREYRADKAFQWGICDGTDPIDQNSPGKQGSACLDQVGRGTNQASYPGYSWGNNWKGSAPTISNIQVCGSSDCSSTNRAATYHIINNRDFFNEVARFDGSVGVGSGPLSSRPSTCTPNVGYFATDQGAQGTLYRCTATNTWTSYYTPYSYPHPLQGNAAAGSPNPPTGLAAVAK